MRNNEEQKQNFVFWIDTQVYCPQNMNNLKVFKKLILTKKEKVVFQETNSIQVLKHQLFNLPKNSFVIVIASASLPLEWYEWMQKEERIHVMGLFCINEDGGNLLIKNEITKIKKISTTCEKVISFIDEQITLNNRN